MSTDVFVEPERDRTPDNRPVAGLTRGERIGGTEGDAGDAYGVGDRTVGINRRSGGLGFAMASGQSQSSRVKCDVVVTGRDSNGSDESHASMDPQQMEEKRKNKIKEMNDVMHNAQ